MKKIKVGKAELSVKLAKTEQEQAKGLMYISKLPKDQGMLFCYPKEDILSFWMKNTKIPLSIAFIDKNKEIIQIEDLQPGDETATNSNNPAKWALEVNQGWFQDNKISKGDKISFFSDKLVKINIVKMPPEAQALAKKIENVLSTMIAKAIKAKVKPGEDIDNFYVDVE